MKKILLFIVAAISFTQCGPATKITTKGDTYKNMYEEKPIAILALPPINRSTKVEAKELLYSSLIVPISLKGYYVMPPLLTMAILKEESAYDAELFLNNSMKPVGNLFGVDAVLFTIIHEWTKTSVASIIKVKIEYIIKSAKTDEVLFNRVGNITLNTALNTGNAFADLLGGMLNAALTKEIVAARQCNIFTISDIPEGPYGVNFGKDNTLQAAPKEFSTTLKAN